MRDAEARPAALGIALSEADEAVGVLERQLAQHNGIYHTEDGRVRANAQTEREQNNQSESGVLPQHSSAEAQVLQQCSHISSTARFQVSGVRFQVGNLRSHSFTDT